MCIVIFHSHLGKNAHFTWQNMAVDNFLLATFFFIWLLGCHTFCLLSLDSLFFFGVLCWFCLLFLTYFYNISGFSHWTCFLSTLVPLMLSYNFVALNIISKQMTSKFISSTWISFLHLRIPISNCLLRIPVEYLSN